MHDFALNNFFSAGIALLASFAAVQK